MCKMLANVLIRYRPVSLDFTKKLGGILNGIQFEELEIFRVNKS